MNNLMKTEQMVSTAAQRAAIESTAREVICLAGPGSGKTQTIVGRVESLVARGTPPARIAAMTFTNAAARELGERIKVCAHVNGDESMPPVEAKLALGHLGTLHSFALRMLREHGGGDGYGARTAMISPESASDLIESKARSLKCSTGLKTLLSIKGRGRPLRGVDTSVEGTVVASYYDELREAGVVDYDLLLTEFLRLLVTARAFKEAVSASFDALVVDEAQDSGPVDWLIYDALLMETKFFVGDPDQAIYGFRGGDCRRLVERASRPDATVFRLEENFRSRPEICEAAQRLIERNATRAKKVTRSARPAGGKVWLLEAADNEHVEVSVVAWRIKEELRAGRDSIAVLARTNAIADFFREGLPPTGVPVVESTREPLPPDWRRARALVELLSSPENDSLAFFYLIALYESKGAPPKKARAAAHAARKAATAAGKSLNRANLGFGRVDSAEIALRALGAEGVSRESRALAAEKAREMPDGATALDLALALAEVREVRKEGQGGGVAVTTVHGAKGREFDLVFVVGFEDEVTPGKAGRDYGDEETIEEERRLAYVAFTRAREALYVSHARSRSTKWERNQPRTASRFVAEAFP